MVELAGVSGFGNSLAWLSESARAAAEAVRLTFAECQKDCDAIAKKAKDDKQQQNLLNASQTMSKIANLLSSPTPGNITKAKGLISMLINSGPQAQVAFKDLPEDIKGKAKAGAKSFGIDVLGDENQSPGGAFVASGQSNPLAGAEMMNGGGVLV